MCPAAWLISFTLHVQLRGQFLHVGYYSSAWPITNLILIDFCMLGACHRPDWFSSPCVPSSMPNSHMLTAQPLDQLLDQFLHTGCLVVWSIPWNHPLSSSFAKTGLISYDPEKVLTPLREKIEIKSYFYSITTSSPSTASTCSTLYTTPTLLQI